MLSWAVTFLVIAIIAALLGFTGIAGTAEGMAQVLFFFFLILFVVFLVMGRRPPVERRDGGQQYEAEKHELGSNSGKLETTERKGQGQLG